MQKMHDFALLSTRVFRSFNAADSCLSPLTLQGGPEESGPWGLFARVLSVAS